MSRHLLGLAAGPAAALALAALATGAPAPRPATADVMIKPGEEIIFRAGKDVITRYHIAPSVAKPFFWPLIAPGGAALTRAWPMDKDAPGELQDHIHQKSAWFCHGDVIPEGMTLKHKIKGVEGVDFWSENPGHGVIACVRIDEPKASDPPGRVVTANEWRTADGDKVLDETRTIQLYDLVDARLLVVDIDLHASVVPITFGDTKEGSFGVRMRTSLTEGKGKGRLTNAEGKTTEGKLNNVEKKGVWGLVSPWCDYSGPVDGGQAGLTLLASPSNPYPTAWHARGYGLMAANPFGRDRSGFPDLKGKTKLVHLDKGEHLKLRYGILLHDGDATSGKVADYYDRFCKLK